MKTLPASSGAIQLRTAVGAHWTAIIERGMSHGRRGGHPPARHGGPDRGPRRSSGRRFPPATLLGQHPHAARIPSGLSFVISILCSPCSRLPLFAHYPEESRTDQQHADLPAYVRTCSRRSSCEALEKPMENPGKDQGTGPHFRSKTVVYWRHVKLQTPVPCH